MTDEETARRGARSIYFVLEREFPGLRMDEFYDAGMEAVKRSYDQEGRAISPEEMCGYIRGVLQDRRQS